MWACLCVRVHVCRQAGRRVCGYACVRACVRVGERRASFVCGQVDMHSCLPTCEQAWLSSIGGKQWRCGGHGQIRMLDGPGRSPPTFCEVPKVIAHDSTTQIVSASVLGTILVLVLLGSLYLVRRHRQRAKALLSSLLKEEVRLVASLLMEVLDMCGDSYILFHYVIPDRDLSDLVAPWVCIYAVACCVSLINLMVKAKLLVEQVRSPRGIFCSCIDDGVFMSCIRAAQKSTALLL